MGTLLGDAHLGYPTKKSTMPRLSINHGYKQYEYAAWKASELSALGTTVKKVANGGYGEFNARVDSKCVSALEEFHLMFYGSGTKRITNAVLDELSGLALAVLICDDGSVQEDYSIYTNGFDPVSIENLVRWFWDHGIECTTHTNSGTFIRTYRKGTVQLAAMINQYIPRCMEYKKWQE